MLPMLAHIQSSIVVQILLVLLSTAVVGLFVRRGLSKLSQYKNAPEWLRTLSSAFYQPSSWLIWVYGIIVAIELVSVEGNIVISGDVFQSARNIFFVGGALWVFMTWKNGFVKILKKRVQGKPDDQQLIVAVSKLLTAFVVSVATLIILDTLGVELGALMAVGGVGAATIGFAGKDVFANFFGGFMININRPFCVGDWIMSPNKNFEGVVEEIGWYMTKIRTFARRPTYIPNALITDAIVENPGRMYNRRIKERIGIRYDDIGKMNEIVQDIRSMLQNHPEIDQNQHLLVHFISYGASSLEIEIYCFCKTTVWKEWLEIQQGVFLKIAEIVNSHGAEFAFPTSTLHIVSQETAKNL